MVEIVQFLIKQQLLAQRYSKLFSHGEAAAAGLPCLKQRHPENLVLWARLRFYLQKPNVIEMRWVELFLVGVLVSGCNRRPVQLQPASIRNSNAPAGISRV